MNRILKTVMIIGLLLVGSVTIYALTNRFLMISQTSNFTKKKIFEFDLSTGLTEAEIGRKIQLGEASLELIAPVSEEYENLNNYSVGTVISHGRNSFILTGDAETLAEAEMLESGRMNRTTVYKAGHHGSSTSSSKKFIDAIAPDYAVISCGEGNSYGHPSEAVIKRISGYTDKIYRTDLCGSVVFVSDGSELDVRTERN